MKTDENTEQHFQESLRQINQLLGQRQSVKAVTDCERLAAVHPERVEALLLGAKALQQQGRFSEMLDTCQRALARKPAHIGAKLQLAEACLFNGRHREAVSLLGEIEALASKDSRLLQQLGEFYAHAAHHDDALRCYEIAVKRAPEDPRSRYNLASAQIATGRLAEAEENFSRVIARNPHDYDAWQNRSTLRKQTASDNHVQQLARLLEAGPRHPAGVVSLSYALAKEHEDLGDYNSSFSYLQQGAAKRRQMMSYRVGNDITLMQKLKAVHGEAFAREVKPAANQRGPVFVLGLPRSGTTLVDRILSSHSEVQSLGEINDFALSLMRTAGVADKQQLLDASVHLDMQALADTYIDAAQNYGVQAPLFIDKTPANYLYLGLIARALPGAVVVHVHRHPLDSCLAMFRTLFRMGYPFSYDLDDLAGYYIAYHGLMQHWRDTFPGLFLDLSYEELVNDQETQTRRLIAHAGLAWEPDCLHFEKNAAPVATASAVQVRQPLYRDALARWRRYEKQLAPLRRQLEDAGIAV